MVVTNHPSLAAFALQVDLQVRIVCGSNIRKTLVEEAKRHAGCTLVLGTNKLSPLG